jgi:8-oxo-dGTP diphosphatase
MSLLPSHRGHYAAWPPRAPLLRRAWALPLPGWLRTLLLWCAHPRYLVAVVGSVWDDQGRLLLARHSYSPLSGWSLPGGWLRADEPPEAGVVRALAEKLRVVVDVGPLAGYAEQRTPRRITLAFVCRPRESSMRPNAAMLDIAYFPLEEALQLVRPELRGVLQAAARSGLAP